MVPVHMTGEGPDIEAVEGSSPRTHRSRGCCLCRPTAIPQGYYTRPLRTSRDHDTAAPDFTIFADDAYAVHHLDDHPVPHPDLLGAAKRAGKPTRVILYGSHPRSLLPAQGSVSWPPPKRCSAGLRSC